MTICCWSKFRVTGFEVMITGFGVMTIFSFSDKWLTINPEISKTLDWVLTIIWIFGQVMDTKIGTNVSNKMLVNAAKCQGYRFYCFIIKVIKVKPIEGIKLPTSPTHIRVKCQLMEQENFLKSYVWHWSGECSY